MSTGPALVVVTPDQLSKLVREAVNQAMAELRQDVAPVLLDRNGIARALGLSTSTLDKLRRDGLPSLSLGDSPRFELEACLSWLREHRGARKR